MARSSRIGCRIHKRFRVACTYWLPGGGSAEKNAAVSYYSAKSTVLPASNFQMSVLGRVDYHTGLVVVPGAAPSHDDAVALSNELTGLPLRLDYISARSFKKSCGELGSKIRDTDAG